MFLIGSNWSSQRLLEEWFHYCWDRGSSRSTPWCFVSWLNTLLVCMNTFFECSIFSWYLHQLPAMLEPGNWCGTLFFAAMFCWRRLFLSHYIKGEVTYAYCTCVPLAILPITELGHVFNHLQFQLLYRLLSYSILFYFCVKFFQLGLQKADWLRWVEKSRCYMLHELIVTDSVFYEWTPKGLFYTFSFVICFVFSFISQNFI